MRDAGRQTKLPGPTAELARRSLHLHEEIQAALGDDFGSGRGGMLMVYETPESCAEGEALVPAQRAAGLDMAVAEGQDPRELEPALAEDLAGAILCRNDFHLDPVRFTQGVGKGAAEAGATVCERTEVTGVRIERGRVAVRRRGLKASFTAPRLIPRCPPVALGSQGAKQARVLRARSGPR